MKYNYFKEGKVYRYNDDRNIIVIDKANEVVGAPEFCLEEKQYVQFSNFNATTVELSNKGTLLLKKQGYKLSLPVMTTQLVLPEVEESSCEVEIDCNELKRASKYTAAGNRRPTLSGVHLCKNIIEATDSMKLYRTEIECNIDESIIIPKFFIDELPNGMQRFMISKHNIVFKSDEKTIISKLLIGIFPDLTRLFKGFAGNTHINLDVNAIRELAKYICEEETVITISKDKISIKGQSLVEGECNYDLPFDLKFTTRYLLQVLNDYNKEELEVTYSGNHGAVKLGDKVLLAQTRKD